MAMTEEEVRMEEEEEADEGGCVEEEGIFGERRE
jgi:hypothetical protein